MDAITAQFEILDGDKPVFVEASMTVHTTRSGFGHAFGHQREIENEIELDDYLATDPDGNAVKGIRFQVLGWIDDNRKRLLERAG